jgi:UPF0716 protein FxsA
VFLLVLIFILVPIAELYVIIKIGGAIGILPTLALLVADALLGSFLLRAQGRAAWLRFNRALAENRLPHKEVFDGVLIIFGGALLMTPGFITDIFGLIFLIPPTRALVRSVSMRIVRGRLSAGQRVAYWGYTQARGRPRSGPGGRPPRRPRPAPGPPPGEGFGWEEPFPPGRPGPQPDDIEGSGQEIRDEDELPPGREPFGG